MEEKKIPVVRVLLSHVKEFKKDSILTPIFMILEVAMEMIIPLLMGAIIDIGVNKGDMKSILLIGLVMVLVALVGLWTGIMGGKCGASASTGFARNLRKAMFRKVQSFSFENIDRFSTSSLVTRLTTDVANVQNAYQMILRIGMRAPTSLIVAMILSFRISPKLASVYLIAVFLLAIIIAIITFFVKGIFDRLFKQYDALNNSVQENVSGIRVVKAYVREDHEIKKFGKANGTLYKLSVKAEVIMSLMSPVMMTAVYTSMLVISWLGAHLIVQNTLTTGNLMSLLTYCMNILMSLMMLSLILVMVTMSAASAKRIAEVLEEEPSIQNPRNPVMDVKSGEIVFENVDFAYGKDAAEDVLTNVNLHIKSGETIGIMGSTGSAKSTLVSLISRLYDVKSGRVMVGGVDVRDYDLTTLRDEVSVVLQQNVLFSGTIAENLRWGNPNASDEEVRHAAELACADEFIEKFPDGYDTHIEQGGTNVSGGQRQRLCIARALLKKPKVLILDDSTSAVDTATDAKIRKAFREEIPDTTKLIISQRITSVKDADRIIVMDEGKIDGFDSHENLLINNKIYQDIYEAQTGGGYGDFDQEGGEKNA